jgi:hypothetical protein
MFDLEQAIAEWRRQMLTAGIKTPALLDELESHLRDEIATQMKAGSSASQALEAAAQELGPAGTLKAEFEKAHGPDAAQIRRWGGFVYAVVLAVYSVLQTRVLLRFRPTHEEFWLGMAGLAATLITAYAGWRLAPRFMSLITNKNTRLWVAILGNVSLSIGWLPIYAWFILDRFEFTPGQFAAAFVWAMLPCVTSMTLLLGVDWSGDGRQTSSEKAL